MDRLVSSWQKIGNSVNSYTYYSYDDMGRAYKSDFCLMGTTGGALAQTYEYTYNEDDGSIDAIDIIVNDGDIYETVVYDYDTLKRLSGKTYILNFTDMEYAYEYQGISGNRTSNLISDYDVYLDGDSIYSYSYTYDNLGNIKTISQNGLLLYEYEYDAQGQLTTEIQHLYGIAIEYIYDAYGNILGTREYSADKSVFYGEMMYYTYGDNQWKDKLTAYDGTSITYDAIGNPLSYYNGHSYTFTWQNGRELASSSKNGVTTTYKYGADGLRTQKKVGNTTYNYYYNDGLLVRQTWGNNYIDFLYDESGLPYSFIYNGTQYYYIKNLQNDVVAIADEDGNIVVEYDYDAWGCGYAYGTLWSTIGEINPIRYRSYYYDTDTGFYYLQSRYYDPIIKRFINADGYVNANGDFIGFNMYAYCSNNPVMYVDYSGNAPDWNMFLQGALLATCGILTVVAVVSTGGTCIPAVALAYAALGTAGVAATAVGVSEMYEAVEGNNPIRDTVGEENYDLLKYGSATVMSFGGAILEIGTSISVCFIAGTEVLSESGHRLIETIEAGDYVWATNPETGETALKQVVRTFENETSELIHITVNGEEIVCTNEHPFYVPVKGWTAACQLRAGDRLQLVNGEYVIVEQVQHEILESPVKVYNFEVEGFHTYYVTKKGVLVHNKCEIVKENGVTIKSLYPNDHGNPAHLHVYGGGSSTKIGPQGLPVKGYPSLTEQQKKVVENNLPAIKKAIKEAQKYLRTLGKG